ncbi:hypothetical protein [Desertimonas flava]|uniref:hypothetical protein n=1 Tax=Desertimonas flava TaxID=2064846 RepID=UPI000E3489A4|nr:hypothetical protein [Desertimonas flava]
MSDRSARWPHRSSRRGSPGSPDAVLTYGNPDDPADPADAVGLADFSAGEFQPLAFTAEAVAATTVSSATVTG